MMSTVQFKRFSEILLVQVDGGSNALDMDWAPVMDTVVRPLEYGTPRKVKFQPEPVLESLEDLGWNDVVPRGGTNSDEDSDPAFDDSLRTNQLAINLKLMRMNVETLERRLTKGLVSYEEALESLGSQFHATRDQVGRDSGIYTYGEESIWEGISGAHVKMDSMDSRIRSEILSEIMPIIGRIKSDAAAGTSALVNREVALATRQLSSKLQLLRHEHHVAISSLESDLARLVGLGGLASHSPICGALNSDFPADWELVLDFLGRHTSPGSGRVGDKIEDCVARFNVVPSLPGGVWSQRSFPEQPGATSPSDQVINMKKEIADLRDRISSNSVSIDSFIFISLERLLHVVSNTSLATWIKLLSALTLLHCFIASWYWLRVIVKPRHSRITLSEQESWNLILYLDSTF
jgi:hypothetical protein